MIKNKHKRRSFTTSLLELKEEITSLNPLIKSPIKIEERTLLEKINHTTKEFNTNNVTRTKAYLDFYRLHPEIHWAFLGHMVSRNGGWNMTDLKGDFISRLLERRAKQEFFSFLERGNWLIFQDAFPQFMLYEESLKRNRNLFHLLSYFNVSQFMEGVWNYFWRKGDKYILTMALVINEQSYLEERVMKNVHFKEKVFNTIEFKLQELLSFNHILFPYDQNGVTKIIGQTLNQFGSLHERILLGKRLYALLFSNDSLLKNAEKWAIEHPHTSSRKDYWPHLFNDVKEYTPGNLYIRRLKKCQLRKGKARLYSPKLEFAWKNVVHEPAEKGDWYKDWRVIDYLNNEDINIDGEIKNEYCETLERLELATIAKKAIFL
ncbi:DUF2515 family protein [Bacillus sp. CGMCC 1.16607]|uniref:DUF2515 family protein n=1 Tax=Bacillus sp. CGMCC 1.16607 TaxID=3351842 RepID=UPI003635A6E8